MLTSIVMYKRVNEQRTLTELNAHLNTDLSLSIFTLLALPYSGKYSHLVFNVHFYRTFSFQFFVSHASQALCLAKTILIQRMTQLIQIQVVL